jgi:hypothetical protein
MLFFGVWFFSQVYRFDVVSTWLGFMVREVVVAREIGIHRFFGYIC